VEPALIFGADLYSEGDDLDLTATGTFEDPQGLNFNSNFVLSPHGTVLANTFLTTHDTSNFTNPAAKGNLRTSTVTASSSNEIDLVTATYDVADGGASYRWSHYGFYPPRLLPLPASDGTVTAYAAVLPEDWPVFSWTEEFFDVTFGSALTKTSVVGATIEGFASERLAVSAPTGELAVGDYFLVQSRIFYVDLVGPAPGIDNILASPLHPFEVDSMVPGAATIQTLYTVGELLANPAQSVGTDAFGTVVPPLYDSPFLDWIRVRRLYPPRATDSNRSILGAFIDATPAENIGFSPALIPATAGGDRDLPTNGVAEFSTVILDADELEGQEILVDYREGIFHLSHPIATGSTLNPNSYLDPQGYPRLYAVFAAYNRLVPPVAVSALIRGGTRAGIGRIPATTQENSPVTGRTGWKVSLGDDNTGLGEYYYYPNNETAVADPPIEYGGRNEALYFLESNLSHEGGPLTVFQKRSEEDGVVQVGAIAYNGRGGSDPDDAAQITFIPDISNDSGSDLTSSNKPDFRVSTVRQLARVQASLFFSVAPADILAGSINGIDFSITLIDDAADAVAASSPATGITVTDGQRSMPEVIADIVNQLPGTLVRGEDYDLSYYSDGTDYVFVFEASRSLTITTDDAALFPITDGVTDDLKLSFGHDRQVQNVLRYVLRERELFFDGAGIRVNGSRLGTPVASSYVLEGFELLETSIEGGQAFISLSPGSVSTPQGVVRIADESRLSLTADRRLGVYFDVIAGTLGTVQQLPGDDTPFVNITVNDVPLYIAQVDAGPALNYTVDVRDFLAKTEVLTNITVGAEGRVATLAGALELAKKIGHTASSRPVIELLEDVTLDLIQTNTDDYAPVQAAVYDGAPITLPANLLFLGNGHTVTVSGVPSETVPFGDPIFRSNLDAGSSSNVEFSDITFNLDAGETVAVSLMAGNAVNNGVAIFDNVVLNGTATFNFNLYSATFDNDALQRQVVIRNCQFDGDVRIRSIDRLIVENCTHLGNADATGIFLIILNDEGYASVQGLNFNRLASTGFSTGFLLANNVNVNVSQIDAFALSISPPALSSVTDVRVSLSQVTLAVRLELGLAAQTTEGVFLIDGFYIDTATTNSPLTIDQVTQVFVSDFSLTSAANVTVDITDSDVSLRDFKIVNTSVSSGLTTKIGIRLQGDNGALISGENAMDSDIVIENGILEVSSGSGIYVSKANEAGKSTVISNNRFVNTTDSTVTTRGILLNADFGTASADNVANVYISHNVFDKYSVSGTENCSIGTNSVDADNFGDVTISFNHARGFSGGATEFFNLAGSITLRETNNGFTQ